MHKLKKASALGLLFFLFFGEIYAQQIALESAITQDHVVGQLLCMLDSKANVSDVISDLNSMNDCDFFASKRLSKSLNLWLFEFDGKLSDELAMSAVERHKNVQIVQFNHMNLSVRSIPNDTLFYRQWAFLNDGTNGGSGLADIDATDAWNISTGGQTPIGDSIVVAIIDQGFDLDHIDLIENMYINHGEIHGNNIDDDGNGYIDDRQGWDFYNNDPYHPSNNHGTHVAGTIGAKGDNEIGVSGVNWDVNILPITGSSTLESTVVEAYAYVLEMRRMYNETNGAKGAYIVATNSSFGVDEGQPVDYPIWCAMYDSLGAVGVLSAGATANDNVDIDEVGDVPTACGSNFLISVTNMRSTDEINNNAGFGLQSIDLGAPGTGIYSTFSNNNYGNNTGTSMATPHVAGAVGLMYSAVCAEVLNEYDTDYSGLALFMKDKLLDDGIDELNSMTGLVKTGGRLNLNKALISVSDICIRLVFDIDSSSCGTCNGTIRAEMIGGSGPINYSWNTGSNADSIAGLCAGIYTVTAVDGTDTLIRSVALSDNGGVILQIETTNASCFEINDGSIIVIGGFNYEWSDGSINPQRTNLAHGQYFLTATDSLSTCITTAIAIIREPELLQANFQFQMPTMSGGFDGKLTAMPYGGIFPYYYLWETGDTTMTISNEVGKYGLTITDANGCEFIDSALLGYPISVNDLPHHEARIRIWPNPAAGIVNIESSSIIVSVRIFDALGRLVSEYQALNDYSININTHQLKSGVYYMVLMDIETKYRSKLVITNE